MSTEPLPPSTEASLEEGSGRTSTSKGPGRTAEPISLRADGDLVLLRISNEFSSPYSTLVRSLRHQLPGVWLDWVAVREAFQYGRDRFFPVGRRQGDASSDEKAKVRVSSDALTAYLVLYPPKPRGQRLTEQELSQLLQAYGIPVELRDAQAIRMALLRRSYLEPEPIAHGRAPTDGTPARVEWSGGLPSDPIGFLEALRANENQYPERVLQTVEAGQTVGLFRPPGAGVMGLSALGRPIAPRAGPNPVSLGRGVLLDADGQHVRVDRSGHLRLRGRWAEEACVLPVLRVRDAQDLEPWRDQVFPGSVIADGDLEVRFPVRILGDMEVRGGLIRSAVEVMGSLFVRDGIIHYGRGPVRVGGIVSASFLDRAWVVGHHVHIRRYSLQSRILAAEDVIAVDPPGNIQGGQLASRLRIDVRELGSPGSMATEVAIGSPSFTATFQDLYHSWSAALRAQCTADGSPPEELVDAATFWERTAQDIGLPESGEGKVLAGKANAGVTVRIGGALRQVGNPIGPVTFAGERIGDRERVAMIRG